MIMMVVTVMVVLLLAALLVAQKTVMTVNLTGLLMGLNAAILPGMSLALIVLH